MSQENPVPDEDIVAYLKEYFYHYVAFPKLEEICRRFGWSTLSTAHERIRTLRRRGLVREHSLATTDLPCPHCHKNL